MSIEYRPALSTEAPLLAGWMAHSFPRPGRGSEHWLELLERGAYRDRMLLWAGVDASSGPIAALCLFSFQQWVGGVRIPSAGVGAVSIAPTHRKRGIAHQLVSSALRHARESGDVASTLYPFRASFYQRLGYGLAGAAHQYLTSPASFPDSPERGQVRFVLSEEDQAAVRAVYDAWAPEQTGMLDRSEEMWRSLFADQASFWVVVPGGGYVRARARSDLPVTERYLEIEEIAWLHSDAARALHGWIHSLSDQWERILYRALPGRGTEDLLVDARLPRGTQPGWGLWYPAAHLLHGPMFRLLQVRSALEMRSIEATVPITVTLVVEDALFPENQGPWKLTFDAGRILVQRSSGFVSDATLTLSIETLSRLYIGSLSASDAVSRGLAQADRTSVLPMLDAALRLPAPWTWDQY